MVVERDDLPGPELWLVVERGCHQETEITYYLSNAAVTCPLRTLVQVGHSRWQVEDCLARQGRTGVGGLRGAGLAGVASPSNPGAVGDVVPGTATTAVGGKKARTG